MSSEMKGGLLGALGRAVKSGHWFGMQVEAQSSLWAHSARVWTGSVTPRGAKLGQGGPPLGR
jgi:hypothetical protein